MFKAKKAQTPFSKLPKYLPVLSNADDKKLREDYFKKILGKTTRLSLVGLLDNYDGVFDFMFMGDQEFVLRHAFQMVKNCYLTDDYQVDNMNFEEFEPLIFLLR